MTSECAAKTLFILGGYNDKGFVTTDIYKYELMTVELETEETSIDHVRENQDIKENKYLHQVKFVD